MTKFRYFLIGVVGICVLILLMSITGLWPVTGKKEDPTNTIKTSKSLENNTEGNRFQESDNKTEAFKDADQMIFGLHLPSYDNEGKETAVVRSKHTALFENKIYKVKEPVIEFKNIAAQNDSLDPTVIVVNADEGIMNMETNVGTLTGNVVIQLDDDTQIKTDNMSYVPGKRSIFTKSDVLIIGEKMIISGQELEVDLSNSRGVIKRGVEMKFKEIGQVGIFDIDKDDEEQNQENNGDLYSSDNSLDMNYYENNKSFVKGSGTLVFDLYINTITFNDDVQAFIGDMTVFTDQLSVVLESGKKKKIKKVIANGDVIAMNQLTTAKGNVLIWDAETGIITIREDNIKSDTTAEFLNDSLMVSSKIIRLYQNNGWVEVPFVGKLITKANFDLLSNSDKYSTNIADIENEDQFISDEIENRTDKGYYIERYQDIRNKFVSNHEGNNLEVSWKERMLFKNNEHLAVFKEDVKVVKPDSQLNSGKLTIEFDENNEIESILAEEDVYISEKKEDYETKVEADTMTWKVGDSPMELTGDPEAKVSIGDKQLSSSKIIVFDNGEKITADNKGNLVIRPDNKTSSIKENAKAIYLEWQGNMVFNKKEGKASFYDRIDAFKEGLNIKCDVFDVFFGNDGSVRRIVALENVYISSDILTNLEGLGTMLTWDVNKNIAILSGEPVAELRREGSRTLAKRVFFDINSRKVTWEGQTQWRMVRDDKNKENEKPEGKLGHKENQGVNKAEVIKKN